MKAYYEALRVGESLNRDKNASNNRIENREGSRDKKTLKMLFNIKRIIGSRPPKKIMRSSLHGKGFKGLLNFIFEKYIAVNRYKNNAVYKPFNNTFFSAGMTLICLCLWGFCPCELYLYLIFAWILIFAGAVWVERDEIPDMFE